MRFSVYQLLAFAFYVSTVFTATVKCFLPNLDYYSVFSVNYIFGKMTSKLVLKDYS